VDREAIVELARRLTTPVDLPALVADGVVRRRGRWYQILNDARLPEWARCQIVDMRMAGDAVLVRFGRRNRAAERLYEELTGEPPPGASGSEK
jgi:hypothetical protein